MKSKENTFILWVSYLNFQPINKWSLIFWMDIDFCLPVFFYLYLLIHSLILSFLCVYVCMWGGMHLCGDYMIIWGNKFFHFIMCVPGIKLRLLSLAASTFTGWALSLVLIVFKLFEVHFFVVVCFALILLFYCLLTILDSSARVFKDIWKWFETRELWLKLIIPIPSSPANLITFIKSFQRIQVTFTDSIAVFSFILIFF